MTQKEKGRVEVFKRIVKEIKTGDSIRGYKLLRNLFNLGLREAFEMGLIIKNS